MAPIRIGILGAAKIAPGALIEPAKGRRDNHIVAVASRNPARAQAFAHQHGIPIAVAGYESLIERDDIDAIYNALPPLRHAYAMPTSPSPHFKAVNRCCVKSRLHSMPPKHRRWCSPPVRQIVS